MSAFFFELGLFSLKTLILVFLVASGALFILVMAARSKKSANALEIEDLSKTLEEETRFIREEIGSHEEKNSLKKTDKKEKKKNKKSGKKPRTFVLDFNGDIKASQADTLRRLVNNVLSIADSKDDEVLICIESPGGMVHGYGLAAAQLLRIREKGIRLTAAVDKVAASGGYLMACVADEIISAPFAVLGSIGVVAQVPNVHRLLKKHDVDYEEMTSGAYKRTVTVFGEITPEGRQHFEEKLVGTHELFKTFVKQFRPQVDLLEVANGDHWYGTEAMALKLVDRIQTSDDFILSRIQNRQIIRLSVSEKKTFPQKVAEAMQATVENMIGSLLTRF